MAAAADGVTSDEEAVSDEVTASDKVSRPRPSRLDLVLGLIAVALLVLAFVQVRHESPDEQRDDARAEVFEVADQVAVRLTSMTRGTVEKDFDSFLALTTGELRRSFESQGELFTTLVKDSQVQSKGAVVQHGIMKIDAKRAEVLVATSAEVVNKETPEGEAREYRMRIVLVLVDEQWRAESLELVA